MEDLQYPTWQRPVVDAVMERDPEKRQDLVAAAEAAMSLRILELHNSGDKHEERLAIDDCLRILRSLKRDTGLPD